LALALDLPFWLASEPAVDVAPLGAPDLGAPELRAPELDAPDLRGVEPTHLAAVAFRAAGGGAEVPLWWRSPIPPGRGQGFSGAARVAGAFLARRLAGDDPEAARRGAREVAAGLEGHPDNAAASTWGSFTVSAGSVDTRLEVPAELAVELWWPEDGVGTDASRRQLPARVELSDAAFSVARAATWVAALCRGNTSALRTACEDRLHQPSRLAGLPDPAAALGAFLSDPSVAAAWLSGSGPTVAALVASGGEVTADLPAGRSRRVAIDRAGVVEAAVPAG
jgi:homoserine kinase